jgi:RNA polymerase sigma factor (sigma-70 family)
MEHYYTTEEVAKILKISCQSVREWKRSGKIPSNAVTEDGLFKKKIIDQLVKRYTKKGRSFVSLRTNDNERNQMILDNRGLAYALAKRLSPLNQYDETVSYALEGLIHAVDLFDSTKHNKFSTYAYFVIRSYIIKGVHKKKKRIRCISINNEDKIFENEKEPIDYREHSSTIHLEKKELWNKIKKYLPKRYFTIFYKRYIMNYTLKEIAIQKNCSKQRIDQIIQRSFEIIKKEIPNINKYFDSKEK